MKIIFLGTPNFAVPALEKLIASKHNVVAVITQTDKPSGRKMQLTECAVKQTAKKHCLPCYSFERISAQGICTLRELGADIMVTCAYGQLLSSEVLAIAKHGVINVHASLLPLLRGASPIQTALLEGFEKTGITIMQTALSMDAGDIISQVETDILPFENANQLSERLSVLGGNLLIETLDKIENNTAVFQKQDDSKATYCGKLLKENAFTDFCETSENINNKVRGYMGIFCNLFEQRIKIYEVEVCDMFGNPGDILVANEEKGLIVATKNSAVRLKIIQLEGKNKLQDTLVLRGKKSWQI